jgi:hypothetical protein
MDNTILAGKYIRKILIENTEIQSLISTNKIFPLLANPDTTFPFITYSRNNLTPVYTKNLLSDNDISFTIYVVSNEYVESLDIANAVRHALEGYRYKDEIINIYPIQLQSITEETLDDAYIQRMIFVFKAN